MFANSHCNSVLTVLKAYVAWQFLTLVMTLRPVSLYSYCPLWSFFLSTTLVFDFLTCTLSPLAFSQLSYAWDLACAYRTIQLVYNFFLGSIRYHQCSAFEFFLNSYIYLSILAYWALFGSGSFGFLKKEKSIRRTQLIFYPGWSMGAIFYS